MCGQKPQEVCLCSVCVFLIWWDLKMQCIIRITDSYKNKNRKTNRFRNNCNHENGFHCNFWFSFCLVARVRFKKPEFQSKQKRRKCAWLLLHELHSIGSSSFIIMVEPSGMKKLHTKTHTNNGQQNYILRYSLKIDVRLCATQLCLSDCNLIISITALAFKYSHTHSHSHVGVFFFSFNLSLALTLVHLHYRLLLSTESYWRRRNVQIFLLHCFCTIDECILLFAMDMQLRLVVAEVHWSSAHTLISIFFYCIIYTIISWSSVRPTKEIKLNIKIETKKREEKTMWTQTQE